MNTVCQACGGASGPNMHHCWYFCETRRSHQRIEKLEQQLADIMAIAKDDYPSWAKRRSK